MRLETTLSDLLESHKTFLEVEVGKGTVKVESVHSLTLAYDTARGDYQRYVRDLWSPWTTANGAEAIRPHFAVKSLGACLFHLLTLIVFTPYITRPISLEAQVGSFETDMQQQNLRPVRAVSEMCNKGQSLGLEGFLYHAARNLMIYGLNLTDLLAAYEGIVADVKRGSLDSI